MILPGIHAYISIILKNKLPYKKWFFPAFLFGSILPDIDYLFSNLHQFIIVPNSISFLNATFAHSIFSVVVLYLLLLITYEWKKKNEYLNIANGILLGMMLHIAIDLLMFNNTIHLFWPLPIDSIQLWKIDFFKNNFNIIIIIIDFLFLRIFASFVIKSILEYPNKNSYFIKHLSIWTKILLYLVIALTISYYLASIAFTQILYYIIHTSCLFMMLYVIYILADSIDYVKKNIKKVEVEDYNRTNSTISID
tara:strand:- start:2643 stop:3395 length:753 start_codon:yes stop_codon:yes gene_type:complete